jgi:hypothetical protein
VPPASISRGQAYVTNLTNTVMQGPDWDSTGIFLAWEDWSGFYDHVVPPVVDDNGYVLRVPGLLISPYAKRGLIDHQVLSFDAYLKFIQDRFLGGRRQDPATDRRPDSRPDVREVQSQLGHRRSEFDFNQLPLLRSCCLSSSFRGGRRSPHAGMLAQMVKKFGRFCASTGWRLQGVETSGLPGL